MPIKKVILFTFIFFGSYSGILAQKSIAQKLDLLMAQGHFKMVYRKAGRLLMDPALTKVNSPPNTVS